MKDRYLYTLGYIALIVAIIAYFYQMWGVMVMGTTIPIAIMLFSKKIYKNEEMNENGNG